MNLSAEDEYDSLHGFSVKQKLIKLNSGENLTIWAAEHLRLATMPVWFADEECARWCICDQSTRHILEPSLFAFATIDAAFRFSWLSQPVIGDFMDMLVQQRADTLAEERKLLMMQLSALVAGVAIICDCLNKNELLADVDWIKSEVVRKQ